MKTIWKFPIGQHASSAIHVPEGGEFLSAHLQHGTLMAWYLVDDSNLSQPRLIHVIGTGDLVPPGPLHYLTTQLYGGGSLVLHLFEEILNVR